MAKAHKRGRVFISYSSKDEIIAENLQETIEKIGYEVWRDKRKLETDWSREIASALAESDIICLLWSEFSATSTWVKHEWLTARAIEKPILPCIYIKAPELPKPLINIQGINILSTDYSSELKNRIETQLKTPTRYDYTILPPNSFLPFTPNPHFVGRNYDLLNLYLNIIGNLNKIGVNHVGCFGMGGSGKTQLAIEFAYRFGYAFEGVYWIQAANQEEWTTEFVNVAKQRLRLFGDNPDNSISTEAYIFALQKYLKEHPHHLLIMDNVNKPLQLASSNALTGNLTPLTVGCNILFTTRRSFNIPGVVLQRVDVLKAAYAYDLLVVNRKPETQEEQKQAEKICNAVGNLPLALVLISGYLNKYRSVSFAEYFEELFVNRLDTIDVSELSPEELSTRHETAVTLTLNSQFAALNDQNAKKILLLLALFPETSIVQQSRLILFSGIRPGRSKIDRPAERAILLLAELNLAEFLENDRNLRLHPLVHAYIHNLFSNAEIAAAKKDAIKSLWLICKDAKILYSQFIERGINEFIKDFKIALEWVNPRFNHFHEIKQLSQILDSERHNLQKQPGAALFFQQMHYRAKLLGSEKFAAEWRKALESLGEICVNVLSVSKILNEEVIRKFVFEDSDFMEDNARIVRFSADGLHALSGCWKKIRYCNVENGQVIHILIGHQAYIRDVRFCKDNQFAVSLDDEGKIIFWELANGKLFKELFPSNERLKYLRKKYKLRAACIDKDGVHTIMNYTNRNDQNWNSPRNEIKAFMVVLNIEREVIEYEFEYMGTINEVFLNYESGYAVSGDAIENILAFWNLKTGDLVEIHSDYIYKDYKANGIQEIIANQKGNMLLTIVNGGILIWDYNSKKCLGAFEGDSDFVNAAAFSPDGNYILAGNGNSLLLWDLRSKTMISKFTAHSSTVACVEFSPDGKMALSGSDQGLILWNIDYSIDAEISQGHGASVRSSALSVDGQYALTSSEDCLIWWNVPTCKELDKIFYPEELISELKEIQINKNGKFANHGSFLLAYPPALDICLSPGGNIGALALTNGSIALIKFNTDEDISIFGDHKGPVSSICFTPDGKNLLTGSYDGSLIIWDTATGSKIKTIIAGKGRISKIALAAENGTVACAYEKGNITLIDSGTGKVIIKYFHEVNSEIRNKFFDINGSGEHVNGLELLSRKRAVICFTDDTPVLWDFERNEIVTRFVGHSHVVTSISLNRSKQLLLTTDRTGTVFLWDINTGQPFSKMYFEGSITSCAFAGDFIIAGDSRGQISFMQLIDQGEHIKI